MTRPVRAGSRKDGIYWRIDVSVFVLDRSGKPLMPCSEKRARLLLERGRARVHRLMPFAIRLVKNGLFSQWGNFLAEGIVARPAIELTANTGDRIITKIKHRDFA